MGGNETGDVYADRCYFSLGVLLGCLHMINSAGRIGPYARQAWHLLRRNGEVGAGADEDFFQTTDELDDT